MVAWQACWADANGMKLVIGACLLVGTALITGCASSQPGLVLDTIGPPAASSAATGSNGTLVVFSAFDPHADFNDQRYLRHYTDYRITSDNGNLVRVVHNDNGLLMQGPKRVELPVGAYHVVARANGYGLVTVPVIIRADQVTTVHLEGGSSWQNRSQLSQSNPVRLPDGDIVGWRASSDSPTKP